MQQNAFTRLLQIRSCRRMAIYPHNLSSALRSVIYRTFPFARIRTHTLVLFCQAQESSILARLLVKHGALNTAISFCIGVLQAVSRSKATSYAGQIPWTTLDILVNAKDAIIDHEMQSSLRQRIREHTARLAQPGR